MTGTATVYRHQPARHRTHLSEPLVRLLRTWLARRPIVDGIRSGAFDQGYPVMSWYSLLAGMGLFPDDVGSHASGDAPHSLAAIDNLIERSARNFPDHRELLGAIPPRPREETLQVYFW